MSEYESTLTDTHILKHTTRGEPDNKGRVKLQYRYDEDYVITSEQIVPDEIKGRVLIAWCDAVRARDVAIMQEREAERTREKFTPEEVEKKTRPPGLPDDPLEMVEEKVLALTHHVENLESNLRSIQDDLENARKNLEKWEKIRDSLGTNQLDFDDIPTG